METFQLYKAGPVAMNVLRERYLKRNEKNEVIETPKDLFERVARCIGSADEQYGETPAAVAALTARFYHMMAARDFEPNTPCLANAGWPGGLGQFSACFVLPVPDDMGGIFETLKNMALIHRSGGGTGFGFSRLRPENDFVRSTTGVASGPVSFMAGFNNTTEVVKQSGIRRGANMGILRCDHPDILQFIDCKRRACEVCADNGLKSCDHNIRNFNISVGITDAFMAALETNQEYGLVNPRTKLVVGKLNARSVWDKIVDNAWFSGEPGLFFIDRVNQRDPLSAALGDIEATNPCGEVPLRAYDACTLGSINLSSFYVEVEKRGSIDFERLKYVTHQAVHFLDNVLTVNTYPLPEIHDVTTKCRKIGLGIMGWADILIKLGIPYASEQAIKLASEVMRFINTEAVHASEELAVRRGPFHYWKESNWAKRGDKPRRNSTVTVLAPTGSISIIAQCNFGIEPLSAIAMVRNQAGMKQLDVNELFMERAKREGWYSDAIAEQVVKSGSCQGVAGVPQETQELFRIAGEIAPSWHVRMQAAFQEHVEDAVSKTINLPKSATREDVADAYDQAWKLGCKGITVYRDGSRQKQVISVGSGGVPSATKARRDLKSIAKEKGIRRRPGETLSIDTAHGSVHVTINRHPSDNEPFECFVALGKSGTETQALAESLGRLISTYLANAAGETPTRALERLVEQFAGIGGARSGFGEEKVLSASDGISKIVRLYLETEHAAVTEKKPGRDLCPSCGEAALESGVGCDLCSACGFSSC
ncbi:MAG TPA: adenosylcobalamin-dependent ribonucleoside-diphosphate reductase [Vicinamibacterales bacterium]|nr:adenosylcobalamin-dependent ribonucleoside-diphosphate reductase [Vicinamibacterales bacterium]